MGWRPRAPALWVNPRERAFVLLPLSALSPTRTPSPEGVQGRPTLASPSLPCRAEPSRAADEAPGTIPGWFRFTRRVSGQGPQPQTLTEGGVSGFCGPWGAVHTDPGVSPCPLSVTLYDPASLGARVLVCQVRVSGGSAGLSPSLPQARKEPNLWWGPHPGPAFPSLGPQGYPLLEEVRAYLFIYF